MTARVLIAGGGLGGLTLAQGLLKSGTEVEVFGRDDGFGSAAPRRPLGIGHLGQAALAVALPAELYDACQATRNRLHPTEPAAFDHQLQALPSWSDDFLDGGPFRPHLVADRDVLKEILQVGLGDRFRPELTVRGFSEYPGYVRIDLSNGTKAAGDALVVADDFGSPASALLSPGRQPLPTLLMTIRGERPLVDAAVTDLNPAIWRDPRPIFGPPGCVLILEAFAAATAPDTLGFARAPGTRLSPVPDYLAWTLVMPTELLAGLTTAASRSELLAAALSLTEGWHGALRALMADSATITADPLPAPDPELPRPLRRVTALTDATRALSLTGRRMAGAVLHDAGLLTSLLASVAVGRDELSSALSLHMRHLRSRNRQALAGGYLQLEQLLFHSPHAEA